MKRILIIVCGLFLAGACLSALSGCRAHQAAIAVFGSSQGDGLAPLPNHEVADLSPDAVVAIMTRAGFSADNILDLGPALRNSIAATGAAQIRLGSKTEALFAVVGDNLHVSSRRRGSFVYDLKELLSVEIRMQSAEM